MTDGSSVRPRLLVLRALGLGDLLTAVPALRGLRRAFPLHELVLATPGSLTRLVELAGVADRVLDTAGLAPLAWSGKPPDVAVNLHGRGPQSHAVLAALGPRRLVAFGCADAGHLGPEWHEDEHEVRRWCRLVEDELEVDTDAADLDVTPPYAPAPLPGAVVVHPGAAYPSRRWPADRFAEVARWARDAGHEVGVTGGPDEVDLAEDVRRRADLPPRSLLAGRTDLTALAAQVASAPLLVCGDTGIAHLATAFGTPSVLLFGPTPPSRWGPVTAGPHTVLWRGTGAGDPWGDDVDPALLRIPVGEVLAAAEDHLSPAGVLSGSGSRTTPESA